MSGKGDKKKEVNLVHWQTLWTARITKEKQSAEDWQAKWGVTEEEELKKKELLNKVIESKFHNYIKSTNKPHKQIEKLDGTIYETVDRTLAKQLLPTRYHLVGKSVTTFGTNPTQKYSAPQTTSQQVGWGAKDIWNLEIGLLENRKIRTDLMPTK